LRPDALNALFGQAVECHVKGRLAEALSLYDAVIRFNPNVAAAHCNRALVLQSLDKLDDALKGYNRAIRIQPNYADAHFNRGIVLRLLNRAGEAVRSYDQAIKYQPNHFEAHNNRGNALRDLKRLEEALQNFDQAIRLKPDFADAHHNRAKALRDLGRPDQAISSVDNALSLKPDFAEALFTKGTALQGLERFDEALQCYERAIELQPGNAEAHFAKGSTLQRIERFEDALLSYDRVIELQPGNAEAHFAKGSTLHRLERFEDALRSYDWAVEFQPGNPEIHFAKGSTLESLGRGDEALQSYDRAIEIRPDFAEVHNQRGNVFQELRRSEEALQCYEKSISIKPDQFAAYNNRGNVLRLMKRFSEAIRSFDKAIEIRPDCADAYWNQAAVVLLLGDWKTGWPLYEWRKRLPKYAGLWSSPQAEWTGHEDLTEKTLLIHAEQGLGDTIQFCRYALLAREKGARVVLAVQDQLARLLKSLQPGIEVLRLGGSQAASDYQVVLMSMPLAFGTEPSTCPASVPYLRAEPERVASWRGRIGSEGFRIGICWQGNKKAPIDAGRSFPLRHFEAIARLPNIRLISLQKHDGVDQLDDLPSGMRVETLGDDFDAGPDAFLDTAAVMECLDLVITSDTTVAHLAGALARPTWVALKHVPDWRWLLDRSDSPWYPTMKLFRQPTAGDWVSVFADMEARLVERIDAHLQPTITEEKAYGGTESRPFPP
jgi:tetratricopeptide (TPR) repeat protein